MRNQNPEATVDECAHFDLEELVTHLRVGACDDDGFGDGAYIGADLNARCRRQHTIEQRGVHIAKDNGHRHRQGLTGRHQNAEQARIVALYVNIARRDVADHVEGREARDVACAVLDVNESIRRAGRRANRRGHDERA